MVFNISVTVSGSTAVVCVETVGAASVKLILRDARKRKSVLAEAISCCSENLSWQKQFHVVQANLIRHREQGNMDTEPIETYTQACTQRRIVAPSIHYTCMHIYCTLCWQIKGIASVLSVLQHGLHGGRAQHVS